MTSKELNKRTKVKPMPKKCDRSSTNDPQTCKSNRQSSPAVHPKSREIMPESPQEIMPESPQASVCLSSGRKIARHRTEKHHQHSSPLFDRARKTSRTVCHEMPRSSPAKTRPTDLQIQPAIKSCRTPKIARKMPESTSKCLPRLGEKIARHRTEKHHQHSSPLFRARKTSRTVCNEMPRSSSKTIKTIQQVCEGQTHAREVRPVVDQRPTDLQIQPAIKSCRTPKMARETMPESPQASACLSSGRKIAQHCAEK